VSFLLPLLLLLGSFDFWFRTINQAFILLKNVFLSLSLLGFLRASVALFFFFEIISSVYPAKWSIHVLPSVQFLFFPPLLIRLLGIFFIPANFFNRLLAHHHKALN
jgi:hypothetical protein